MGLWMPLVFENSLLDGLSPGQPAGGHFEEPIMDFLWDGEIAFAQWTRLLALRAHDGTLAQAAGALGLNRLVGTSQRSLRFHGVVLTCRNSMGSRLGKGNSLPPNRVPLQESRIQQPRNSVPWHTARTTKTRDMATIAWVVVAFAQRHANAIPIGAETTPMLHLVTSTSRPGWIRIG